MAPGLMAPMEPQSREGFGWASVKAKGPSIVCHGEFSATWLQTPPRDEEERVGDWLNSKRDLPNSRGGNGNKSYLPPFDLQKQGPDKMLRPFLSLTPNVKHFLRIEFYLRIINFLIIITLLPFRGAKTSKQMHLKNP